VTSKLGWELPISAPPDRLEAFRDPIRAAVIVASAGLILGSRLPWIEGMLPYHPHVVVGGYDNAGDGAITLLAALFTLGWALRRQIFDSRHAVVVTFPLVIGLAGLVISRVAAQNAEILIADWEKRGGNGSISVGLWLTAIASLGMAITGAVHVWRLRREVRFQLGLAPGDIGAVIGGVSGAIGGVIAATTIVGQFVSQDQAAVFASAQVLILLPTLFLGAWIGAKIGRTLGDGFRPMPPSSSTSTRV
jgi:hypothetical protein